MRVRLMTSSPTAFIMRSRRSSEMRTDFTCRTCTDFAADLHFGLLPELQSSSLPVSRQPGIPSAVTLSVSSRSTRSKFRDSPEQGTTAAAEFRISSAHCLCSNLLQNVDGLEAQIHNGSAMGCNLSFAQPSDQILHAMRDTAESRCKPTCAAEPFIVCMARKSD